MASCSCQRSKLDLPRVRTCAPLLHALASSGAQRPALDLWRLLRRRGVEFTPAEHGALLQMHARAGASRSVVRCLRKQFPALTRTVAPFMVEAPVVQVLLLVQAASRTVNATSCVYAADARTMRSTGSNEVVGHGERALAPADER